MSNTQSGHRRPTIAWTLDATAMRDQIAALQWPHYVYALCDSTGSAFYIGKGRGDRLFHHAKDAAAGGHGAKCEEIRALGDGLRYAILLACSDDAYALGYEALLIRQHFEALTNEANGAGAAIQRMTEPPKDESPLGLLLETLLMAFREQEEIKRRAKRLLAVHPELRERLQPIFV